MYEREREREREIEREPAHRSKIATPLSFIVPTACLLATRKYTYAEARAALRGPVRLNALIAAALI